MGDSKSVWCERPGSGGGHKRCSGCSCDCHNPTHKTCRTCGELKSRSEYPKALQNFDGLQSRCLECKRAADAEYRAKLEPGYHRDAALRKYGLTQASYEVMLAEQGGGCAICGSKDAKSHTWLKLGVKNSLHVDHDHETGKVRGILCGPCNHALGKLGDDPERIRRAAAYLDGRLV